MMPLLIRPSCKLPSWSSPEARSHLPPFQSYDEAETGGTAHHKWSCIQCSPSIHSTSGAQAEGSAVQRRGGPNYKILRPGAHPRGLKGPVGRLVQVFAPNGIIQVPGSAGPGGHNVNHVSGQQGSEADLLSGRSQDCLMISTLYQKGSEGW